MFQGTIDPDTDFISAVETEYKPLPIHQPSVVAAGAFTEITEIVAPASAAPGSQVDITVKIKNIDLYWDHLVACVAISDGTRFIDEFQIIPAGQTSSFSGHFTMPSKDVTIYAYSYYPYYQEWILDDQAQKDVDLAVAWQKLAIKAVTITPEIVAWQKLATKAVTITPEIVAWQKLATKAVTITPLEVPPDFKLVVDIVYPDGKTYNGPAERAIVEFKLTPEQIPGTKWLAEEVMADKIASEVEKEGAKMLTLKVYENTVPTLWTEYIFIAEATKPAATTRAVASPLAWTPIILAALAIVGVIVFYFFLLRPITEFIYKSPGAAIGAGLILLGAGALAVLGIAMYKGTSVKEAVTGKTKEVRAS